MSTEKEICEKLRGALASLGLNKNAVEIYLDLLRHNDSSALEISERTRIHRSNTYDALRELKDEGFISEVIDEKRKLFATGSLDTIKNYLIEKEREIGPLLKEIKSVCSSENNVNEVSISHSFFAFRESLNSLLKEKMEILVLGASFRTSEIMGFGFLQEFHKNRIKESIPMRMIFEGDAQKRVQEINELKISAAKCTPDTSGTPVSTNICNDKVIFFITSESPIAITIRNQILADYFRSYFEILWKRL